VTWLGLADLLVPGSTFDLIDARMQNITSYLTCAIWPELQFARANSRCSALGGGVWTRDINKGCRLAKAIRAGSVWINYYQAMDLPSRSAATR